MHFVDSVGCHMLNTTGSSLARIDYDLIVTILFRDLLSSTNRNRNRYPAHARSPSPIASRSASISLSTALLLRAPLPLPRLLLASCFLIRARPIVSRIARTHR